VRLLDSTLLVCLPSLFMAAGPVYSTCWWPPLLPPFCPSSQTFWYFLLLPHCISTYPLSTSPHAFSPPIALHLLLNTLTGSVENRRVLQWAWRLDIPLLSAASHYPSPVTYLSLCYYHGMHLLSPSTATLPCWRRKEGQPSHLPYQPLSELAGWMRLSRRTEFLSFPSYLFSYNLACHCP